MSRHHYQYPWPSPATLRYIPYRHRAVVCRSSCLCSSIWWGPQEYVTDEFILLLHQNPACLVRLTWIVFVMGGKWLYSYCFVGCCPQDLFNIPRSILVTSFLSIRLVRFHIVHPFSSIDMNAAWKKMRFILSIMSDFLMTDRLSIAVHAFTSHALMSVSVNETLLPWYSLSLSLSLSHSLSLSLWYTEYTYKHAQKLNI